MEEQLISFETAKLAKEKGFNEYSIDGYNIDGDLMTIDRSQESFFFEGASRKYNNSELEGYNKEYNNSYEFIIMCIASTQSLLQKWLREKHNIHISIFSENNKFVLLINYYNESGDEVEIWLHKGPYNTYEEALEIGLQEALKLIK